MTPPSPDIRISEERAQAYTRAWISAWNAHDLDAIMEHYAQPLEFTSPLVLARYPELDGTIRDLALLREYFGKGLASLPNLRFELLEVLRAVRGFTMYYVNAWGGHTAEYVELDEHDKAIKVVACYAS